MLKLSNTDEDKTPLTEGHRKRSFAEDASNI